MNFDFHGITFCDISTYQDSPVIAGTVDFVKMKAYGFRAVCFRAMNGIYEDVDFQKYRTNVADIIPWFAYAYYNNLYTPKQQAQKLFSVLAPNIPPVVVLDLEDKGSGYKGWRHWYDWLIEFQRLSGLPDERIWIYTNEYYFGDESGLINAGQRDFFKRYPLWLASYPKDPFHPPYALIKVPDPWDEVIGLQTGTPAIGRQAGVESIELDYDQFNGDEEKFIGIFGGTPTEPEPPNGGTMLYVRGTTTAADSAGGLKVRSQPSTSSTVLGSLPKGTVVEGWLENGWIQILYNGKDAYVSADWVTYVIVEPPGSGGKPASIDIVLTAGSTVTIKDAAGNVLWSGTA